MCIFLVTSQSFLAQNTHFLLLTFSKYDNHDLKYEKISIKLNEEKEK